MCIDPGHGPGCPNGAPDGTYKEDEFAQSMGYAVQRHLERCGVGVLVKTAAPAILIEYGFHTSRGDVALLKDHAYRAKLAQATAKGVCDYLGIAWVEEPAPAPGEPWYAGEQAWVKAMGVSDGTRPEDTCTRAEQWAMAHNLYKAIRAGR